MFIGFTERMRTVSEADVFPGDDIFNLRVDVSTERVSEREHRILYQVIPSSTATVVGFDTIGTLNFDARFGIEGHPLEEQDSLIPGQSVPRSLVTQIRADFIPEDEECFTIQISPLYESGVSLKEYFMCNDGSASNYFCEHTICIEDYSGRY